MDVEPEPRLTPSPGFRYRFSSLRLRDWLGISDGILYYQIMNGITGTAMPYFKRNLKSQKLCEGETSWRPISSIKAIPTRN